MLYTIKPVLSGHSKKKTKIGFHDRLSLNAGQKYCRMLLGEHSAVLLNFIKPPFVINIFFVSILEWPIKTGFTVSHRHNSFRANGDFCRLLITFANSLGPDQDRQNLAPSLLAVNFVVSNSLDIDQDRRKVGSDLDQNRLTLC